MGLDVPAGAAPASWEGLSGAQAVIAFLESLPVTKGIAAGESMRLLANQRDFVEAVYGEGSTVRIGVKSEPRGNGKTGLVAGLALCHLLGPQAEERGQVFSASIDRSMAALIFAEMAAIILAVPSFATRVNIQRFHKKIEVLRGVGRGSVYEALSADARRGHGLAPSLWIYDEFAQARDGRLFNALKTAMGKSKHRPLGLVISTQAEDDEHPLSKLIDDGLSGEDPTVYVQLTAAPTDADPFEPETIRAVNPAMGLFLDEATVMAEAAQARRVPLWEAGFRNLRLNQRVNVATDERLASADDWRRAERAGPLDLDAFAGRFCWAGLDLSGKRDLTALALVFPDETGGYDVVPFFWTPEEALAQRSQAEEARLRDWIRQGHVEMIPGPIIRYDRVAERIAELRERFDLQVIAYDRYRIEDLKAELAEAEVELPLQSFGQGHSKEMAPAIEFFTEMLVTGRLHHFGNPALTASVLNALVVKDTSGNPKLDKSRSGTTGLVRIDGAVALVMALGTARRFVTEYVDSAVVAV
jgi:phage terminase large subunit-like protein